MAIKITTVGEAVEDTGLKILVHGLAGAGKTVLCATTGAPTLILSIEGGLLSIKDAPKYIQTAKIESIADLREAHDMLVEQRDSGEQIYDWIALDSLSDIAETVLKNEMEKSADPRKSYPAFQAEVTSLVKAFRDLAGYNVVMTAKMEMSKDEFTGITYRSPSMPGNKLGPSLPYLFDEVFALRVEKDEDGDDFRTLQTCRDIMYEAKDRSGMLNTFEEASLKHIYNKIHGNVVEVEVSEKAEQAIKEAVEDSEVEAERPIFWYHEESDKVGISSNSDEFEQLCDNVPGSIVEITEEQYKKAIESKELSGDSDE